MPSTIEWTDETWNVVTGCTKVSAGCENCYAERMARRLAGRYGYPKKPDQFDVTLHPDKLDLPLRWRKPRRVFVCSMGDLFHKDVSEDFIISVFARMTALTEHIFQVLTKRSERMLDFITRRAPGVAEWSNIWLGVTVESPEYGYRAQYLREIPAAIRFISFEPLLASFAGSPGVLDDIDWCIVGPETGPGARGIAEFEPRARGLRDQCVEAGVAFFLKKNTNGTRQIDGREWNEMPAFGSDKRTTRKS